MFEQLFKSRSPASEPAVSETRNGSSNGAALNAAAQNVPAQNGAANDGASKNGAQAQTPQGDPAQSLGGSKLGFNASSPSEAESAKRGALKLELLPKALENTEPLQFSQLNRFAEAIFLVRRGEEPLLIFKARCADVEAKALARFLVDLDKLDGQCRALDLTLGETSKAKIPLQINLLPLPQGQHVQGNPEACGIHPRLRQRGLADEIADAVKSGFSRRLQPCGNFEQAFAHRHGHVVFMGAEFEGHLDISKLRRAIEERAGLNNGHAGDPQIEARAAKRAKALLRNIEAILRRDENGDPTDSIFRIELSFEPVADAGLFYDPRYLLNDDLEPVKGVPGLAVTHRHAGAILDALRRKQADSKSSDDSRGAG